MSQQENFPVGSLLIRSDLRPAVKAFYRFARAADHVADDPATGRTAKLAALARFEAGLAGEHDGAAEGRALRTELARLGKPSLAGHAAHLLQAFRQDTVGADYEAWGDLLAYCERSANPVGRFLLDLHDEGAEGIAASDALCSALQVLNHLQDLRDDYLRLGRAYLPSALLDAAGAQPADLGSERMTPALRTAVDAALDRVDVLLAAANELPDRIASARLAGETRTTLALARRLSARLRRSDPLARRVRLTRLDFVRAGFLGAVRALRPQGARGVAAGTRERA